MFGQFKCQVGPTQWFELGGSLSHAQPLITWIINPSCHAWDGFKLFNWGFSQCSKHKLLKDQCESMWSL
jgi:hypothetical protein